MANENAGKSKLGRFLARKNIHVSFKAYAVEAMSSMAFGLFASLLIGTIFSTLADKTGVGFFGTMATYAKAACGPAMAAAIGYALHAPSLVLFSLCAVGYGANELGGPLGTLIAAIIASELGKVVSKETKIDILITPTVTIAAGIGVSLLLGPAVQTIMDKLGEFIMTATELRPFYMGIVVSVVVGMLLTLPISSAAICFSLSLVGLAGGAATAGCCAQMVGFAVMSFRENRWGGVVAQGLGTSMLQMGNILKNPIVWLPPTIVSAITGPVSTCVFRMQNGVAIASGMGTCGLVGPIGVVASNGFGGLHDWIGMLAVCVVLPCVLTPLVAWPFRKLDLIKPGDLKLDL